MRFSRAALLAGVCGLTLFLPLGCSGGTSGGAAAEVGVNGGSARLLRVDFGRLVDVYSFDRSSQDPNRREEVLYRRDVVIGQGVISTELNGTQYVLREADPKTGRAQLVIMRDRDEKWALPGGSSQVMTFPEALADVEVQATKVAPGRYDQNTSITPFDVVPRNAAIKLTFESDLSLPDEFFLANPNAIQVLEIRDDPQTASPTKAFRALPVRFSVYQNTVVIDPVVIGEEYKEQPGLQPNPSGLPESPTSEGANVRIAIPVGDLGGFPIKAAGDLVGLGSDRKGRDSVIRDFRSGNRDDDYNGFLVDQQKPYIVGDFQFGILAVDTANNTITVNKRAQLVTLRSRVIGAEFRPGDMIIQEVKSPLTGETVRIKAEIDDPTLNDSGVNAVVTVKVTQLYAYDSKGNQVWFSPAPFPIPRDAQGQVIGTKYTANSPRGEDVEARVIFEGERDDPSLFLKFSPPTSLAQPGVDVDPFASVGVTFSEPVSKVTLDQYDTIMLATTSQLSTIQKTKLGRQALVVASLVLDPNTAMAARLVTPLGFNHEKGKAETYYLLILAEEKGEFLTDLAGNRLDLRDNTKEYLSAGFQIDDEAADNPVANIVYRFDNPDEDGTTEGADWGPIFDANGQFTMRDGRIYGAQTVRFPKYVEEVTLRNVIRGNKGDCHQKGKQVGSPWGVYLVPRNVIQTQNGPTGGTQEPLNTQGSRLMVTWREDDLGMSYTDLSQIELDIEQLYWASWMGNQIEFDIFDRVTLALSHCERRPDMAATPDQPSSKGAKKCLQNGASLESGLKVTFAENVLDHTEQVKVYEDAVYQLNPNHSFLNEQGVRFLSYPEFQTTYTWRDRRLSSWDTDQDMAIGLGGVQDPENVVTTDVPSPWYDPDPTLGQLPLETDEDIALNQFFGSVVDGMSPICLPLLLDFKTYPDDPNKNGGLAKGINLHFIGHVWALWPGGMIPHGYYLNPGGAPGLNKPFMRVHATGGTDSANKLHIVDPNNTFVANGGWLQDIALGLHQAPPGDCHVQWGRADFLRRVSVITYGFVDTTRVNKHRINGAPNNGPANTVWDENSYRPAAFEVVTDPPLDQMPTGTMAHIDWRGVEVLPNDDVYHPSDKNNVWDRGNLLNPHYACDAYRLAAIHGRLRWHVEHEPSKVLDGVDAKGFTRYERNIDSLMDSTTGLAPRYLNWRIVFTNNTTAKPPVSPFLDSFGLAIKMEQK